MHSRLSLAVVACLIGLVSCGPEDLYKQVFVETSPKLDRAAVIQMLNDPKGLYQGDPEKRSLIEDVLEKTQVSEHNCGEYFYIGEVEGRARELLKETRHAQGELCKKLWATSASQSIAPLEENDENFAASLIKSMMKANGGKDFTGYFLDYMPYLPAQRGVLQFMEQQSKKKYSKWARQDKFDGIFDEFVYEPCGRIVGKLDSMIDEFVELVFRFGHVAEPSVGPIALGWAKKGLICRQIRGFGYSSTRYHSFRADLFQNMVYRKLRN